MMKLIQSLLTLCIFVFASISFGGATEAKTGSSVSTPTPKTSAPSITNAAAGASKDNAMGKIMNIAVSGVNFYTGYQCSQPHSGCQPMAPLFFLMGIQNLMQAAAQDSSSSQANSTFGATDTGLDYAGYDPNAVNTLNTDPELKVGNDFRAAVTQGKAGFQYDPKTNTVTTAKGTKIKGSDLNNPSALAAAGVPKSAIDMMNSMEADAVAKAAKKVEKLGLNTNVVAGEEGGGGGSGSSSSATADTNGYGGPAAARGQRLGVNRDPSQIAGLQKSYNGEPIGVASDSLFKMMTRRYKVKESQSTFLNEFGL